MKIALTGGAYQARSVIAAAQRCLNLYSEPMPQAQGEPAPWAYYPMPGLLLLSQLADFPVRGIRQVTTGGIYAVAGQSVFRIDPATWAGTLLGSITPGLTTPVSMADNGLDLVIVDGTASGWTVHLADDTFAAISDPTGTFVGADKVDYIDTFFIFNNPGTPQFYWTKSLQVAFDPASPDKADKETFSDELVTLAVAKKEIYLLGERTTEIWYDAALTDPTTGFITSQFAPIQGVFIDHGCAAKYSAATYDNSVFWLSRNRAGQGIIMMAAGYQSERISTYAIEKSIAGYSEVEDAIGFCFLIAGHAFYVLSFPAADRTWAYDITTHQWTEWHWSDSNGNEHRHRAACFYLCDDTLVVGDREWSNLYALDLDTFTDWGFAIKRERSYPHIVLDGRRLFYREFLADMDVGSGPDTTDTNMVSLIWSNDRGHSYGNPVMQSLGGIGEYLTSMQWQRLGMARDRVFKLSWTVNAPCALQGAWITIDPADAEEAAPKQGQAA